VFYFTNDTKQHRVVSVLQTSFLYIYFLPRSSDYSNTVRFELQLPNCAHAVGIKTSFQRCQFVHRNALTASGEALQE